MIKGHVHDSMKIVIVLASHANIAGVDPVLVESSCARGELAEEDVPVVVKITDDGHGDAAIPQSIDDLRDGASRFPRIDRDANQFGSGRGQRFHLSDRCLDVSGIRVGHGLDGYGMLAANPGVAQP